MVSCNHLDEEVRIVKFVVNKNLDGFKWMRHIANPEEAKRKFIEEYSFLCRDIYCQFVCKEEGCIHKQYERHNDEQYLFPDFKDGGMGK